jgi:hypothetical protein
MGYTSGMNPQEPVIPDPDSPGAPSGPVKDPVDPAQPAEYSADSQGLDAYDEAVADSFPASDPPAASEPGAP